MRFFNADPPPGGTGGIPPVPAPAPAPAPPAGDVDALKARLTNLENDLKALAGGKEKGKADEKPGSDSEKKRGGGFWPWQWGE